MFKMDYSCQDVNKITNPGLKRLYTIRCNRYKASEDEPVIVTKQSDNNLNINYLYLLLFILILMVLFYNINNNNKRKTK